MNPNLIKKLTVEDCEKGYHDWEVVEQDDYKVVERCPVCRKTEEYRKFGIQNAPKRWVDLHKLDLLQPRGKSLKDFIYYYGERHYGFNPGGT